MRCRELHDMIERDSQPLPDSQPLSFTTQYAQSSWVQYTQLLKRLNITYWRNVPYNGTRFIFAAVIALLLGCVLWNIGTNYSSIQNFFNILGALYIAVLFLGIINANSVQPIVQMERLVRGLCCSMFSQAVCVPCLNVLFSEKAEACGFLHVSACEMDLTHAHTSAGLAELSPSR